MLNFFEFLVLARTSAKHARWPRSWRRARCDSATREQLGTDRRGHTCRARPGAEHDGAFTWHDRA